MPIQLWNTFSSVCVFFFFSFSLQIDPTSNLTFNLRLSEVEREAKEKTALPFVFTEEKYDKFMLEIQTILLLLPF